MGTKEKRLREVREHNPEPDHPELLGGTEMAKTNTNTPRDISATRYISLAAGTIGAMIGEYTLAVQTGMDPRFAWTYPVALDAFAYVAFRTGRRADVALALGLMAVSQALTHLVSAHILSPGWPIVITVWALILPTVLYRIHHAATSHKPAAPVDEPTPVEPTAEAAPVEPETTEDAPQTAPADELAPKREAREGRRTWRKADALKFISERSHMTRDELAAEMRLSARRVNQLRAELVAA